MSGSVVTVTDDDRIHMAVCKILQTGCKKYLENTNFGIMSAWYHGSQGKTRANKIIELTNMNEITIKEYSSLILMKALLKTNAKELTETVTKLFIDDPTFSKIYKNTCSEYASRGIYFSRNEIILSILEKNIQTDDNIVDITSDSYINNFVAHLNNEEPLNAKFLFV